MIVPMDWTISSLIYSHLFSLFFFAQYMACLFIFWRVTFDDQKFLVLMKSTLSIFLLWSLEHFLFQHHLLKWLSFTHWIALVPFFEIERPHKDGWFVCLNYLFVIDFLFYYIVIWESGLYNIGFLNFGHLFWLNILSVFFKKNDPHMVKKYIFL